MIACKDLDTMVAGKDLEADGYYLGTLMVIPVGWENVKVFLRYMYLMSFQEDSAWSVVLAEFQLVSEISEGSSKLADSDLAESLPDSEVSDVPDRGRPLVENQCMRTAAARWLQQF